MNFFFTNIERKIDLKNKKLKEANLINGRQNLFGIYQVIAEKKSSHNIDSKSMPQNNEAVSPANYELVYVSPLLFTDTPEKISSHFNKELPEGIQGRPLLIGDIIVQNKNRMINAFYLDSSGFVEIPHFIDEIRQTNNERIVEELEVLYTGDTVELYDGLILMVEHQQHIDWHSWFRSQTGVMENGAEITFHICEVKSVRSANDIMFQRSPEAFLSGFYVIDDLDAIPLPITKYSALEDALAAYESLNPEKKKAFGAENIYLGSLDLIQHINGTDYFPSDYTKETHWLNPEAYAMISKIKEYRCVTKSLHTNSGLQTNQPVLQAKKLTDDDTEIAQSPSFMPSCSRFQIITERYLEGNSITLAEESSAFIRFLSDDDNEYWMYAMLEQLTEEKAYFVTTNGTHTFALYPHQILEISDQGLSPRIDEKLYQGDLLSTHCFPNNKTIPKETDQT